MRQTTDEFRDKSNGKNNRRSQIMLVVSKLNRDVEILEKLELEVFLPLLVSVIGLHFFCKGRRSMVIVVVSSRDASLSDPSLSLTFGTPLCSTTLTASRMFHFFSRHLRIFCCVCEISPQQVDDRRELLFEHLPI